jgi:hypothetical protein
MSAPPDATKPVPATGRPRDDNHHRRDNASAPARQARTTGGRLIRVAEVLARDPLVRLARRKASRARCAA